MKRILFLLIIVAMVLLALFLVGCSNRPVKLTVDQEASLAELRSDLASQMVIVATSNLKDAQDGAGYYDTAPVIAASRAITDFVEQNPNMVPWNSSEGTDFMGPGLLTEIAGDFFEDKNPELKEEALRVYLLYLRLYPKHENAGAISDKLRIEGVSVPDTN